MKVPEARTVPIDEIKADNKNPNKMSEEKFEALKRNIKKYGFLIPVITNKELLIADGQHRWTAAKELGMKDVPVISLDVSEVDRKMLRQVLNKLRGMHDDLLDADEFKFIYENDCFDEFKELLALNEQEADEIRRLVTFEAVIKEKEIDENLETENICPRCSYRW